MVVCTPLPLGALVGDRYEIQTSIGKLGRMELFLALDRSTKEERALEVLAPDHNLDDREVEEWARRTGEWVDLAQRVSHPNVCRVYGVEPSPWGPIVITEHVPGTSLHRFIRDHKEQGGVSADDFRRIAADLQGGLAAMHAKGVIHADIKPGKIKVTPDRAVIHYFWSALPAEVVGSPDSGEELRPGTPNYMSLRRLHGGGPSFKDDVYALAMTLWEMLTCRVPNAGENPRDKPMRDQIMCDLPASMLREGELRHLFRALHKDAAVRPDAKTFFNDRDLAEDQEEDALFAAWARAVTPGGERQA